MRKWFKRVEGKEIVLRNGGVEIRGDALGYDRGRITLFRGEKVVAKFVGDEVITEV